MKEFTLGQSAKPFSARRSRIGGFSMLELVVSMALVLILAGISLPSFTRSYRIYELNGSATRLAGIFKLTRFEAIRRNTTVTCQIQQAGANWILWADSDGDGIVDPTETQFLITGTATLLPAGSVPNPAAITSALRVAGLNTLSGANNSITYDARGAVALGGNPPTTVSVLYLGNAGNPDFGYRAVVLLPSGITQVWAAPGGGNWRPVS